MKKKIIILLIIVLVLEFVGCAWYILAKRMEYREESRTYELAAENYVTKTEPEETDEGGADGSLGAGDGNRNRETGSVPIKVDFEGLSKVCGDIVGWIYCEDTVISYPVVHGEDNDYYLTHSFDGAVQKSGTVFVDANNTKGFSDSNTIIYGHYIKDGSMFASLKNWSNQEFYEEHSVMWLLTPEQDYKILLFSGYTTPALSDSYLIFIGQGEELDEYVKNCATKSNFRSLIDPLDPEIAGKYVMLSTCAYSYTDARYVLHGVLVPVEPEDSIRAE
ncbi:MAG: class B sortase [bacterium]|nr:class B sortase [bacterium]